MFDRLRIARHIATETPSIKERHPEWELTDEKYVAADIDKNNEINAVDKLLILRHIATQLDPIIAEKHADWKIQQ